MKKNISYRDKLLELARIYNISDIRTYIKNKKNLTTAQIEHILKKNKVPIPTEINKSILEIHSKKISRPINLLIKNINYKAHSANRKSFNFLFNKIKSIKNFIHSIIRIVLDAFLWLKKTIINTLNSAYNFKVEEKKANKVVSGFVAVTFLFLATVGGSQLVKIIKKKDVIESSLQEEVKVPKIKEAVKAPKIKEAVKAPKIKEAVKVPQKKEVLKEFILPDLNLKTETVLALFDDVEYDLKVVRKIKLVKPIYFTQFPKDLDEILSVQLKKETFIKIVLPLVVAENQKILDDRNKFLKVSKKKMTSDKEKSWLRQKFKEYKVTNGSVSELNKRMDIIPVSIAIAQAAKESGWGTSRFALEGNAIFGQWTWNGRGIEPLDRSSSQRHKILRFPILRASVKAYKNNLNTHKSYKKFREIRHSMRLKNKSIKGLKLIHTLDAYAQTGAEYTKILAQMITQNALADFENVRLTNSVVKKELNL
jgi:Bax protein